MAVRTASARRWAAGILLGALAACGGGEAEAPGSPVPAARPGVLAIAASPRLDPFPATPAQIAAVYTEAFDLAFNAGARGQVTTATWRALEDPDPARNALDSLLQSIATAASRGMTVFVGIQPINTGTLELPADLAGESFDSPVLRARFRALLDRIIRPHVGRIRYLSIGNEVDAWLRANPAQWNAFRAFLEDARSHAKSLDPAISVGTTATAEGALTLSGPELTQLASGTDVTILTYYGIQASGTGAATAVTVRNPSEVARDFLRMLAWNSIRPLVLQEVGYPAAALNGSSEAMQAQFFANAFAAWRAAGGRIPFLGVFLLHDFTPAMCESFGAYYGLPDATTFKSFLCSLGLRTANGTPRAAWATVVQEASRSRLP